MVTRFASIVGLLLITSWAYAAEQPTLVRVTTYWREEGQFRAAWNGARLRNGHCAVDPKKIHYGSRILLEDEELIAVDTGPAVVSRKAARLSGRNETERNAVVIDRYFETKSQAVAWEKSRPHFMKARVLSPGAVVSKKSGADHTDLPPKTRIATRETTRQRVPNQQGSQAGDLCSDPPALHSAIPIGDLYLGALLGLSSRSTRDARRRTGGEVVVGNLVERSRGRPLDRFRLLQIT
jgi:3D (Asp-Asp-Asp) domain-containing protein